MTAVVFDLDGTLIDSAPDLAAALNRVLAAQGLPALGLEAVRGMVGDGAAALVQRAWAAHGKLAGPAELAAFLADYEANATVETAPYPGILEALEQLAGHALAVCTNKPKRATEIILEQLGLARFFQAVLGGDSTPYRKPDPRHLAAALQALGAERGIMIGDHENDMAAARGLNIPSIFVAWGYGKARGSLRAEHAAELPALVAYSSTQSG